jgi:hypothetical protein
MARDQDVRNSRLYDRRTVERNIKKGLITRKDYEKHLKTLEDVADKGVYGVAEEVPDAADEAETETETGASSSN